MYIRTASDQGVVLTAAYTPGQRGDVDDFLFRLGTTIVSTLPRR